MSLVQGSPAPQGPGLVLVVASSKGGAGKSTVIACLATWWRRVGRRVGLVDADPNRTLARWHAKGNALAAMDLVAECAEDRIIEAIAGMAATQDLVLVDCPGFGNQATVFAIGVADLVLIPAMTDEANIFEALRMRRLVESAARLTRRPIPSRTLLTRVKRAGVAAHSLRQLVACEAEPLTTRIADRSIYQEATFHGASPVALAPKGAATREIAALAAELESLSWWKRLRDQPRQAMPAIIPPVSQVHKHVA